ncbi:MAG TPA: methyltransferase domain-containing protein [Gemmatimonadaceae bacterium]|nr:methyltransferase domain-containing protein [Gemmatimonadaceae bacterium]
MRDLRRYHRNGPDKTTRVLLDALKAEKVAGLSVLDIGAGIGVVQHELLAAGAASALHVDATSSNIRAAREEATRQGHADRVAFLQGDFVALAPDVREADVVTLDRVICCYPNMEQLVAASASRARRLYGAVFPRERWFGKAFVATENFFRRVTGNAFRSYIHPVQAIDAAIRQQGLTLRFAHETIAWRVAVYSR